MARRGQWATHVNSRSDAKVSVPRTDANLGHRAAREEGSDFSFHQGRAVTDSRDSAPCFRVLSALAWRPVG